MNYWVNHDDRRAKAVSHTQIMSGKYRKEIAWSIAHTQEFPKQPSESDEKKQFPSMTTLFECTDSVSAIKKYYVDGEKICVLDFASYNSPGGKFIDGSSAQEESLCHESFLYNVLHSNDIVERFYDKHKGASEKCLYTSHMLYIPGVMFRNSVPCDVIVCAAPNKKAAMKYHNVMPHIVDRAMEDRCAAVLKTAWQTGVDTLILGAFGCGVFGNSPSLVANAFGDLLSGPFAYCFKTVVFAVPDEANGHYFRELFDEE